MADTNMMEKPLDGAGLFTVNAIMNERLRKKQDSFTPDGTLTLKDGTLGVTLPTKALTAAEYDALPNEEKMADVEYIITDDHPGGGGSSAGAGVPPGFIGMWHGTDIPDGWALCDGTNGTPDLRGRFVLGSNDAYQIGDTGGYEEVTLTVEQLPEHNHPVGVYSSSGGTALRIGSSVSSGKVDYSSEISQAAGSGEPHSNMPPYYVLAYIMKL